MRPTISWFLALGLLAGSCVVPGAEVDPSLDRSVGGSQTNGGGGSGADDTTCAPGDAEACWESADGVAFEGEAPTTEQATCRAGQRKCQGDGRWAACLGAVGPEAADTCEPGNDGNCNGVANEGCKCSNGDVRPCGTDEGNCKAGTQTCVAEAWSTCEGQVVQAPSDGCDRDDDANCNGVPNEGCDCVNGEQKDCGTDIGPCEFGKTTCVNGVYPDTCEGGVAAAENDTCEPGNDANCNNTANEECKCTGSGSMACGITQGACELGMQTCTDGKLSGCSVTPTTNDTCFAANDANDTNCNGNYRDGCQCVATDAPETCPDASGCGQRTCDGATGKWGACVGDGSTLRCNPASPDSRQVCNENGVWTSNACPAGSVCRGTNAACKLVNGQSCSAAADCDSGACTSFYVDADKDGYSPNTTAAKFCGTTKTGYVTVAANKGTDCNDGSDAVNPGTTEACDGLDNDCDNKIDLADGLPLSNAVAEVGPAANTRFEPEISWSAERSLYGVIYQDDSAATTGIYFTTINQAGVVQTAPINAGSDSTGFLSQLVWGGDNFGLSWVDGGDVNFRTVGSNGSLGVIRGVANSSVGRAQLARIGTGNWAVLFIDYASGFGYVTAKTVSAAGAIGPAVSITTQNSNFGVIVGTSTSFATAVDVASATAKASVYTSALGAPASLVVTGTTPVIGRGPSGFAIAVLKSGAQPELSSFDDNGNASCGPVKLADAAFTPKDIVGTADGYLVVGISAGTVRAQLIKPDCSLGPLFTVDATAGSSEPRISGGTSGYGVVWSGTGNKIKRRFFGPRFCN